MALTKEVKNKSVEKFGKNTTDTGSTGVQVALLTERIRQITEHLKIFKHDYSAKAGLLKLVAKRRKFLRYLESTNPAEYTTLLKNLDLKK